MASKYPTAGEIRDIFAHGEKFEWDKVFERVDPNVDWTVMGTHPLAGRYNSAKDFQQKTLGRLGKIMKPPGLKMRVRQVVGGGPESPWSTIELVINAECNNGFKFDNTYAWVLRFGEDGNIHQVRAYLDTALVKQALEENEESKPESHRAPIIL